MNPRYIVTPLTALLLTACGNSGDGAQDDGPELVIGEEQTTAVASLYQMPTPNELFSLVRNMAGEGHKRMLNPEANGKRYVSRKARALNFGVFATDLVYASYFKLNVEVARYYLATKRLAESLGVNAAFTDEDFIRLEANITKGQSDSLEIIGNAAYQRAYEKLQQEDMGPTLALVLAGGWVEGMHLVTRQIDAFGASNALVSRVGEQKVTLEHLLALMEPHAQDADVAALRVELMRIRDIYDQVNVTRIPQQERSTSGRMVLGDEVVMEMTPEKYASLVQAVDRLRATIIMPEDANTDQPS